MAGQPRKVATKPAKTLEQRLWDTADALRGNQEPSDYKHIVSFDNDPKGLVDVDYNSCEDQLHFETVINSLALISQAVGETVSAARRQP